MSQVPELIEEYSQSLEEIMASQVPEGAAESGEKLNRQLEMVKLGAS